MEQSLKASSENPTTCDCNIVIKSRLQFILLCGVAIGSSISSAAMQEGLWHIPHFTYSGYMTLVTSVTMTACGQLERMFTGDTIRIASLRSYLKLSLLVLSGMYFTNWSLKYLNYPTRVLFKSSKLVPTMIMGTTMQGRRYSGLEYFAAFGLVAGILLFTLGDAELLPSFHPVGVALILIGVVADAATSNFEEREFFRTERRVRKSEIITYSSLFGTGWALLTLLPTTELGDAIEHSVKHSKVLPLLIGSSLCAYISVWSVLILINLYGATVTELVKSMRKVLTIMLSFMLYPKPISNKYLIGGVFVIGSLVAIHELQRHKGGDVKTDPEAVDSGSAEDAQPLAQADYT